MEFQKLKTISMANVIEQFDQCCEAIRVPLNSANDPRGIHMKKGLELKAVPALMQPANRNAINSSFHEAIARASGPGRTKPDGTNGCTVKVPLDLPHMR